MKQPDNLLIGIYFHPEAYPPTLNAIGELRDCFDHITVIHRPHLESKWQYPVNVTLVPAGKFISAAHQQTASFLDKIGFFLNYLRVFYLQCKQQLPSLILVYDNISLYAYQLISHLLNFKHDVWYHNHDVTEMEQLRKFSIGWFAANAEHKAFKNLDIFSLPSNDRLKFFPMQNFKGKYFFIPNYPSKKFFSQFYSSRKLEHTVKIIFQGQIAPFRGIEQIIPLLSIPIQDYNLELGLIGPCSNAYRHEITNLAEEYGVLQKIYFNKLPYSELPAFSATYHIGIALLSEKNIMTATIGTASNKLYEYAAVGLPVVYYNNESISQYLGEFIWAVPADLNMESVKQAIINIIIRYDECSAAAHRDFLSKLNYEKGFAPVKNYLQKGGYDQES